MYMKFPMHTEFMFLKSPGETDTSYKFSSDLEKIGSEWDVEIQNRTYVEIIEGPIKIEGTPYGALEVFKIRADIATDYHTIIREFWVPVDCIIDMRNK
jgi:hypothetical protein